MNGTAVGGIARSKRDDALRKPAEFRGRKFFSEGSPFAICQSAGALRRPREWLASSLWTTGAHIVSFHSSPNLVDCVQPTGPVAPYINAARSQAKPADSSDMTC